MNKRISVMLDDDVYKKLLLFKAKMIQENHNSCSYSEAINYLLRKYFLKK
jgi:predicted CopG family antitoxin